MYFSHFFEISDEIDIKGNMEITPFKEFSPEFGNIYWYFQYQILKDEKISVDVKDITKEYKDFFFETEVNFEWINITDNVNYHIYCKDGKWSAEINSQKTLDIINKYYPQWNRLDD